MRRVQNMIVREDRDARTRKRAAVIEGKPRLEEGRERRKEVYSRRDVVNLGNARDGPVARQPKRVIIEGVAAAVVVTAIGVANSTRPLFLLSFLLSRSLLRFARKRGGKRKERR